MFFRRTPPRPPRPPTQLLQLTPDREKIQEAILYLLTQQSPLTQFQIVKSLWFADRSHVNEYGRPVTFDNYTAMEQGPVPSLAYNALKPDFKFAREFGSPRPWRFVKSDTNPDANKFYRLREPRLEYLSETDREALDAGLKLVRKLTPTQLRKMVHDHPAWKEAWDNRPDHADANPMKLSLIIENDGEELAKELAYLTEDA